MSSAMFRSLIGILGPRVPEGELQQHATRYVAPSLVFSIARILLLSSIFVPYWNMVLHAPQYPDGLHIQAYMNRLEGDVEEVDRLNHYIGMRPLGEAAAFEKQSAIAATIVLVLLIEGVAYIHNRYAALLALPAILFPVGFLADLHFWMSDFGQNLDPHAPLSHAIKPFVPPVLGTGHVGQFYTVASAGLGLQMAAAASVLMIVGLYLHRRAYKPLVDSRAHATGKTSRAAELVTA